jgi:hypothetical protein
MIKLRRKPTDSLFNGIVSSGVVFLANIYVGINNGWKWEGCEYNTVQEHPKNTLENLNDSQKSSDSKI